MHVPPQSAITVNSFTFWESAYATCDFNYREKRKGNLNSAEFTKDNSPLVFRNYVEYAFEDSPSAVKKLDHPFHVSKIHLLSTKEYFGKSIRTTYCNPNGDKIANISSERPYKKPGQALLYDRNGDVLAIPAILKAAEALKEDVILAGEICCFVDGKSISYMEKRYQLFR